MTIRESPLLVDSLGAPRPMAVGRDGLSVTTAAGRSVVDLTGGSHASCLAYAQDQVVPRAFDLLSRTCMSVNGRTFNNPLQQQLADLLVRMWGDPSANVALTSGGTEAFEMAARLVAELQRARGFDRPMLIGRQGSYHGMSDLALNVGNHPVLSQRLGAAGRGLPTLPRCESAVECDCAERFGRILAGPEGESIGGVIVEPIAGTTSGAHLYSQRCLQGIREVARASGRLFVCDEVVTFWRTGQPFCSKDLEPDLIMGAKCLSAGFAPLGCVVVSAALLDELTARGVTLPTRLTFSGNAVASAFGLAVQDHIVAAGLPQRMVVGADLIERQLHASVAESGADLTVKGTGYLWAVHVNVEDSPAQLRHADRLMRESGVAVMLGSTSPTRMHVMYTPPFDATDADLADGAARVVDICSSLAQQSRGR